MDSRRHVDLAAHIARLFGVRQTLPVILQAERAECGLACVAMILCYHGLHTDLNTLRNETPPAARGASLTDILQTAEARALHTRALRLELEELSELQLPAILHWDMTHFVVLQKASRAGVVIHDPAVGRRRYTLEETGRHFTGVAIECIPRADFRSGRETRCSRLQDLFVRYPGFHVTVVQLFVLSLLLQLAAIGSAFHLQLVIDAGVSRHDRDFLAVAAIAFFLVAAINVAMTFARSTIQLYFSNQLGFQMAGNVFSHLVSLPTGFFARRHVGDLVSRFGAVREIRHILTEDLITVVLDGLFAVLSLAVMYWFNALLATVVLIFVVLLATLKLLLIPLIRTLTEQKVVAEARTSSALMENMRAIEIIKFYCRELARVRGWRNLYAEQINANVHLMRSSIRIDAVYGILAGLENVLVIYLAALSVLDGKSSLGFLTAFVALKGHFSSSIRSCIDKLVQIRLLKLQLERVSDITCAERELETLHLPALRHKVLGQLQLKSVTYSYPGDGQPVLEELSLEIGAGEIVAIVGSSGSGKSTLIRLLAGLLEPDAGAVMVDGITVRELGLREYRDQCAGVLQADQLLSGTLLENITLFAEEVDLARVRLAARQARIDEFIDSLPMGLNSPVGDMGSIMSAGQAQRILLARAFYKKPRVLFLDEATAHLDPAAEVQVLREIQNLGITTVLVTHRAAPLEIAQRVFRCSAGTLSLVNPAAWQSCTA